jgi:hypothetical protein
MLIMLLTAAIPHRSAAYEAELWTHDRGAERSASKISDVAHVDLFVRPVVLYVHGFCCSVGRRYKCCCYRTKSRYDSFGE